MRNQRPRESKPLAQACGKSVAEPGSGLALPPPSQDEGTDPAGALQTDKGKPRHALGNLGTGQPLSGHHLPQQLDMRGSADVRENEMEEQ